MTSVVDLEKLISPAVTMLGYELWGIETAQHELRVFIDTDAGVTLEDCERVSHQLSTLLDVEDPMADQYNLEVSSPGMDRRLFKPEQYKAYQGRKLKLKTQQALDGQRRFKGELRLVTKDGIELIVDGEVVEIPFSNIERANLVAEF